MNPITLLLRILLLLLLVGQLLLTLYILKTWTT